MARAEPAPAAYVGADKAPPFTWRAARQNLLVPYLAPLVFFGFSIAAVLGNPALSPTSTLLALLNIVALALAFAAGSVAIDLRLPGRVLYCLAFIALMLAGWPLHGATALQNALFVPALCALFLPPRWANGIGLPWGAFVMGVGMLTRDDVLVFFGAMAVALVLAISLSLRLARSEAALAQTRLELEQAMLAAERERIARDMHDILGQSLTAIALKGDVVDRALERNADLARTELSELRTIARSALTDLRATTTGLRTVEINTEIASARAVLRAAGIEARIVLTQPVPSGEAPGYVVREAVTNVARHSQASWCEIIVGSDEVTVIDDGCGVPRHHTGSGLAGLERRVQEAGGHLEVAQRPGGGTLVRARFGERSTVLEPIDLRPQVEVSEAR